MKEAKKVQVTEQICKQVQLMRKGGANQVEIGRLLNLSGSTVNRIEKAGFSLEQYLENKRIAREKEQKSKVRVELVYDPSIAEEYRREQEAKKAAEEQIAGQMAMDLTEAKPEMTDQVKMMRFMASQADKLALKLDHINDTLCQILRAVRHE